MSKTSIDNNNPNYYNGDNRKAQKGSKVRQSHGVVTKNQLYSNNPHNVNASQDLINFKNGQSSATQMNFFKGNSTQNVPMNQKTSGQRKSQSTGR